MTLSDGSVVLGKDHLFKLDNGLNVTYGEINGLAGDFYGTSNPICKGANSTEQTTRFVDAYNTLAKPRTLMPTEATKILSILQTEVDAVNNALQNHQDPSVAYSTLPDQTIKFQAITSLRWGIPSYLKLAQLNFDHFGIDARTAYNIGHARALDEAVSGDLERAYTINAFADHFLEDSFSAGHLRTPREYLHSTINGSYDLCAKVRPSHLHDGQH